WREERRKSPRRDYAAAADVVSTQRRMREARATQRPGLSRLETIAAIAETFGDALRGRLGVERGRIDDMRFERTKPFERAVKPFDRSRRFKLRAEPCSCPGECAFQARAQHDIGDVERIAGAR